MRVLILGGDGYLGWSTALHLSDRGHDVGVLDNFIKRRWEKECRAEPLLAVPALEERVRAWKERSGRSLELYVVDLCRFEDLDRAVASFSPDAIVHYAEQPSAPFSMRSAAHAALTQQNNVVGTLNLLWAMRQRCPSAHLVKLGTMGEYGTPNIDIEEGFIEVHHKGRSDILPFPMQPGSYYHLSKVHDTHNIRFACRAWGLRSTDLNQGVVYGIETPQTSIGPQLCTSFHYDETFGTVLNRFCVQAAVGVPLTVYGGGGQKRGFLNIVDTLQCVELALLHPPDAGYRVFNQFTEIFSVAQLAAWVERVARGLRLDVAVGHCNNPRVEAEEHYYRAANTRLESLGLKPRLLDDELITTMIERVLRNRDRVDPAVIAPMTRWR